MHAARSPWLNELALQARFPSGRPLTVLNADVGSNPQNYKDGDLLPDASALEPLRLPIYKKMRVFTRNVRKNVHSVNGMVWRVQSFDPHTQAVEVLMDTGFRVMVLPWTDPELGNIIWARNSAMSPCSSIDLASLAEPTPP